MHDTCTARLGLLAVLVDRQAHERHLTGEVDVIGARVGGSGQHALPELEVRADRGADDAGSCGHRIEGGGGVDVGDHEGPGICRCRQVEAHLGQLVFTAAGKGDLGALWCELGQVGGGQLADKSRGPENDDVELPITHDPDLTDARRGRRKISPTASRCLWCLAAEPPPYQSGMPHRFLRRSSGLTFPDVVADSAPGIRVRSNTPVANG